MTMEKTYIIAEAGVNHNGSLDMAIELIDAAAEAGADAVKFQTFKAGQLVSRYAPKAEYQKRTTAEEESQLEMLQKLELSVKDHEKLLNRCNERGIHFLSTPFDIESLHLLVNDFRLPIVKIPSGEITNAPLLLEAARSGCKVILSTGMASLGEVEAALGVMAFGYTNKENSTPSLHVFYEAYSSEAGQQALQKHVALLHCTTEYPTPFEDVNLKNLDTLRIAFGVEVGLSDHTPGIAVPIAAAARGARIIEKHFTLNRNLPGPDHLASLEPEELSKMIKSIREVESALGSNRKYTRSSELKNKPIARKSIVAATPIKKGEAFSHVNITVKRPGTGISPIYFFEMIGKIAERDYEEDEVI